MFKKILIVAGVLGVAAVIAKKIKESNDERALWTEATSAPDLR
ncbi:DLW-39 family protein [Melissospora conviva]